MNTALDTLLFSVCATSFGIFLVLYIYFIYSFSYWKKKGVAYLEPSFPFGNVGDVLLQRSSTGLGFQNIYNKLEGCEFGGVYILSRPALVVREPEMIKSILVKDFEHFHDRGVYFDEKDDPLSAHLFMLTGQKWRNLRAKLTPTFTSGKIKMMFPILVACSNELRDHVELSAASGDTVEIKDMLAKFSTDVIALFAFGIQCNCLQNPDAEFRNWGRKIFQTNLKTSIRDLVAFLSPNLASILKIPFVPPDVTQYFKKMVKETIKYRESNNVTRNDFMQLLIQMKSKGTLDVKKKICDATDPQSGKDVGLTLDEIAAQVFVFFAAGFETSSTTMSFCLYELALNPHIQERVRKEIDAVLKKHGDEITYEAIQEMEYLDKTISETLRKYPPVPFLTRECTKKYAIPGTNITLEKGTSIAIPVLGIHKDPKYYPNPEEFDPDRFQADVKSKRHHFTYLPFGEGPRICIGMRFGLLQTKVGLVTLLSTNRIEVSNKTSVPLKYDTKTAIMTAAGGIWLKIVKRT